MSTHSGIYRVQNQLAHAQACCVKAGCVLCIAGMQGCIRMRGAPSASSSGSRSVVCTFRKRFIRAQSAASFVNEATPPDDGTGAEQHSLGPTPRSSYDVRFAKLRAIAFFTFSMAVAIPLFLLMLAVYPFVYLLDRYRRRAEHAVNKLWARISTAFFNPVDVEGWENVPDDSTPAVYVANHESYMDIFALFHLGKDFKFVSKPSIFLIPIVGWSMWLTGHISLDRADTAAGFRKFIAIGKDLLSHGASLAIFPEGTRSVDGKLAPFKKGAFTIASMAGSKVVPITILGSGDIMPSGREGELHPGRIRIVVHPAIDGAGMKTADISEHAREVIASRLPAWKVQ